MFIYSHSGQYMEMDSYTLIDRQLILDHSAIIQYPVIMIILYFLYKSMENKQIAIVCT